MRLRTIVTPLLIAALAISLTGCGAGSNASTRLIKKVTDGQEAEIRNENNNIALRNFVLVALEDGSAVVVGTVINRGENDDALLGLAIPGIQAQFTGVSTISQNQTIRFEGDSANAKAVILGANLKPGTHTDLSLFFGNAGEVKFDVLVQKPAGIYEGITA
ncbi:MAG: hypothetical protein EBY75_05605 [Actinobacteria bacterium]|jgi:hypothetical protein|nr:hypothetical protein [Actinomycetota bacterium]NDA95585.1 hypothetical protein [Actinomycetota bacterium]NDH81257.1 hypothetical protein [Actinomycetota bacterium]NDH99871.1 hypothetical protein [Actinomycetota bacterium]NDI08241.1 hypothetical protein [Actinomycetota bacterium]